MSFGTIDAVNVLLVRLRTDTGLEGLGEAVTLGGPTWSEETVETAQLVTNRYLLPLVIGKSPLSLAGILEEMHRRVKGHYFAKAALECALFDLLGKAHNLPLYALLGGKCRERVPLSWSLATGDIEAEIAEAQRLMARGQWIFKLKTGVEAPEHDVERVAALRTALGERADLRIDANQGWDVPTAIRTLRRMEPYRITFAEQPVPRWDIEGLAAVSRSVSIPVMADESVCTPQEALRVATRSAARLFSLKLTKSGGFLASKKIAGIAEAAGISCYVGCMIETSVGTAAYLHFALSTPQVTYGCELFGPLLLQDDIVQNPVRYDNGYIEALEGPGLGVQLDEGKVQRYRRSQ
ncbi:MAG: chloromuconate cycloisomerase, partial [Nitrospinota bacterium]